MWVSKDGKFLMRGELNDMTKDVLAENRAKLDLKMPRRRLEIPTRPLRLWSSRTSSARFAGTCMRRCAGCCRTIRRCEWCLRTFRWSRFTLGRGLERWPGAVPIEQEPKAFWKMYDLLYDNQDLISAANAWDKMVDYAGQAGLKADVFKACMTGPEAVAAVDASIANGKLLEVGSTPTLFVNGRRIVGADPHQLEQFLQYEISKPTPRRTNDQPNREGVIHEV